MTSRFISRLRLNQFRNYASLALDLDSHHVVLTGANGAGKTNLIEALSLFSPGRGMRRAPFETLTQLGADGWAVAVTLETADGPVDIGTGLQPGDTGRRVRINGANAPSVEALSEYVRLLWLTPDMDALFRGPASDRRRFLDRLITTLIPGHGKTVSDYEKAMRQRNKLIDEGADPSWISAIETQMAEYAGAIHFARADSLGHLQALVTKSVGQSAFPAATLALTPLFEEQEEPVSSSALELALVSHWRDTRSRDRAAGRTLTGPHRVDLLVTHTQKSMPAHLCSTGEQKALLIGLVLAQARLVAQMTNITPILLLDELAAHLDPDRRVALFAALDSLGTQCWMTGTDQLLFESLGERAVFLDVADGRVKAETPTV